MLGEKVAATISARYYFGGEVSQAKVKYDIIRFPDYVEQWYPAGRWDWLFGPGYWWFAADSPWYPWLVALGHRPAGRAVAPGPRRMTTKAWPTPKPADPARAEL